jgi:hypothetical protein
MQKKYIGFKIMIFSSSTTAMDEDEWQGSFSRDLPL